MSIMFRYVFSAKFSDATGETWFSIFHEQAEILLGCSADELAKMKSQEEATNFLCQLKKAKWVSFLFRICVARTEYKNVKRQKISVIDIAPVDFAADSRLLLNEISANERLDFATSPNFLNILFIGVFDLAYYVFVF
ncbi:hypothetical protein L6452_37194 [Arctium lappa]|uniref:Uncharacterized protein n=1 Tax=Arctium lappa TaxID=4217 RepID=A0ACB8Y2D8_ARCLA|nr:hypothetical protein L6452_37194 [Arctium lappa]